MASCRAKGAGKVHVDRHFKCISPASLTHIVISHAYIPNINLELTLTFENGEVCIIQILIPSFKLKNIISIRTP